MQYKLEFEEYKTDDIDDYYIDQAPNSVSYADRKIDSVYTPYGIKCIDSQYCALIQNMDVKIKQLYHINRRKEICINKYGNSYEGNYLTYYDPIEIPTVHYDQIRVEWENGNVRDFYYGNMPIFDKVTRKSDPDQLQKEIKDNIYLHVKIKENLLENIKNKFG